MTALAPATATVPATVTGLVAAATLAAIALSARLLPAGGARIEHIIES